MHLRAEGRTLLQRLRNTAENEELEVTNRRNYVTETLTVLQRMT
jgi:hypothetical protein